MRQSFRNFNIVPRENPLPEHFRTSHGIDGQLNFFDLVSCIIPSKTHIYAAFEVLGEQVIRSPLNSSISL